MMGNGDGFEMVASQRRLRWLRRNIKKAPRIREPE